MIFQEPMTSLNPVFTLGDQIAEAVHLHEKVSRAESRLRSLEMLKLVRMADPEQRLHEYPHQLSGGMRQRVMIAMALVCRPDLVIADEPTTALDVTIQAQILDLLSAVRKRLSTAILLITHDLGVVAETCDEVAVMYAGKIVERAPTAELFSRPLHPYTIGLIAARPTPARLDRFHFAPYRVWCLCHTISQVDAAFIHGALCSISSLPDRTGGTARSDAGTFCAMSFCG